jgi:hypothetical protein
MMSTPFLNVRIQLLNEMDERSLIEVIYVDKMTDIATDIAVHMEVVGF